MQPTSTSASVISASSPFVALTHKNGTLFARPVGPGIGEREASIVAGEIRQAIAGLGRSVRVLVLDLGDVQIMSSFGLGMCIELRNALKEQGIRVVLFGLNSQLHELFRMMKVDRLYTIAQSSKDLARAIAA